MKNKIKAQVVLIAMALIVLAFLFFLKDFTAKGLSQEDIINNNYYLESYPLIDSPVCKKIKCGTRNERGSDIRVKKSDHTVFPSIASLISSERNLKFESDDGIKIFHQTSSSPYLYIARVGFRATDVPDGFLIDLYRLDLRDFSVKFIKSANDVQWENHIWAASNTVIVLDFKNLYLVDLLHDTRTTLYTVPPGTGFIESCSQHDPGAYCSYSSFEIRNNEVQIKLYSEKGKISDYETETMEFIKMLSIPLPANLI